MLQSSNLIQFSRGEQVTSLGTPLNNFKRSRFKVKLISVSDTFPSLFQLSNWDFNHLQMSDWLHPQKYIGKIVWGLDAKLNFYWISITYTYSQPWHRNGKKRHKNPSHKRWSILNYYRGIQNVLCTCVNQLYALLIARCTKLTPQRTYICTGLICNQKLMKITLQPHFLLLQNVSLLRDNFDGTNTYFAYKCNWAVIEYDGSIYLPWKCFPTIKEGFLVTFPQTTKTLRLQKHPISWSNLCSAFNE